ncbi:MAG TPA: thioredoxin domain-containing protein, partial [Gemmatimonadales bacterium]|nr:thioredoxin domain-containing protein [Gemmatimonadales bacterium]
MTNRLSDANSAYLRSAAHQPVHWHPWGAEAFAAAQTADRPILLDIGAVWCHWCHVMDGESYEDPALGEFLNQNFTCVKVDRDERPDVDTRYQRAVQAISGQGGWPLTAFLTPTGEVFYGGTYFPPDGKYGRPGFRSVLEQVLRVYRTQREQVLRQAGAIRSVLEQHLDESMAGEPSESLLSAAAQSIARLFDARNGGFGTQPKFPHPSALRFLLTRWYDTGEEWARDIVLSTLQGMARGGIHDQLGGGFHRYSVDAQWIVPHFEKMSYDNAELLRAYLDAYAAFGDEQHAEVARGIVRWIREVLAGSDGGFGASQDADVGLDDDGDYFTWTFEEAASVLTEEELAVVAPYYDIGTAGEMHHNPAKNVLYVAESLDTIAQRLALDLPVAQTRLREARSKLLEARGRRATPFVDRTRYTSWNAMLAGALLQGSAVLNDPWAGEHALHTLRRLRSEQTAADELTHTAGGISGMLEDQVFTAMAAIDAFEYSGDRSWLEWAGAIMHRVWADYLDSAAGGLYDLARSRGGEGLLPAAAKPVQDAPTPSGNGMAGLALARLAELTGAPAWGEWRDALVRANAGRAAELGLHGATMLLAVDWVVQPATHLVVVEGGDGGGSQTADAMHQLGLRSFFPRRVVHRVRAADGPEASLPTAVRGMLTSATGTRG